MPFLHEHSKYCVFTSLPSGFNVIVIFCPQKKVFGEKIMPLWRISIHFVFFFIQLFGSNNGEVYSSASEMVEVFKLERELVSIMDGFANKLQTKLDKINAYLEVSTPANAK